MMYHSLMSRFYDPPPLSADGQPGDLIRSTRFKAYVSPGIRLRAHATRILYRSTDALGNPTTVSGTILIPPGATKRETRGRAACFIPLVGYAIGTHGIG